MKTFFNRSIRIIFFIVITFIPFNKTQANTKIIIDHLNQEIIAPKGENFQWFVNGNIAGTGERIKPKISTVANGTIKKVYIIGDSTVMTYNESSYPQMGWGQVFKLFFDNSIEVVNKAIGARSSRTFWEEGRWKEVTDVLDSGDYVFIQFGHNDRDWSKPARYTDTTNYKNYLRIYVNETRAKGATPVLVSPMIMHAYTGSRLRNVFTENENNYRGAMYRVACELSAPFVDLNMKSHKRISELGQEYSANYIYLGLQAGEYPNFPDGKADGTHFQEMGALEMARLIMEGIKELENDSNMTFLIDAMLPTYQFNISMNSETAGLVTKSGDYPAGAQVTLKTRIKTGYTFNHWADTAGNILSTAKTMKVTVGKKDTNFVACVTDCNNVSGGDALYDLCGTCTGGTTGLIPCFLSIQSEYACSHDGKITTSTINNIAKTYIDTDSINHPAVIYSIKATQDTVFYIGIVYFTGDSAEITDVFVDDEKMVDSIQLDSLNKWAIAVVQLPLKEGINKVKVMSRSVNGGILFDLIAIYSGKLSKGTCVSGIEEEYSPASFVFPNPFNTGFNISMQGNYEYRLYNSLGMLQKQGNCDGPCYINEDLQKGVYLIQTIQDSESATQLIRKY